MKSLDEYQLFLFDFDGLLVNSEQIHFRAYQKMCANHGIELDWEFSFYCKAAHYESDGLQKTFFQEFPELQKFSWEELYQEKKSAMVDLYQSGAIELMPGVVELLEYLQKKEIKHCVVTHSPTEQVALLREQNPVLNSIPRWFTREDYSKPKPDPECYLKAIKELSKPGDPIIGFEDTPRGLRALMQTPAEAVLVTEIDYPEIPEFQKNGANRLKSLHEVFLTKEKRRSEGHEEALR